MNMKRKDRLVRGVAITLFALIFGALGAFADEGSESAGSVSMSGEESGTQYTLNEIYDQVRGGARLILGFDARSNTFVGIVTNPTSRILKRVRIEIHLSNGAELGPTIPTDLYPGETRAIRMPATAAAFVFWTAHPEVGIQESGSEGSEGSESGSEGSGEHGGREGAEGGSEGAEGNEGIGASALMPNEIYDVTSNGARLILAYDAPSNSFVGTVRNASSSTLTRVRVEIHLSNGAELGPTTPTDMAPGAILQIKLPATDQAFATWSPHAEVGSAEGGSEAGHDEGSEGSGS